jgi:hypothetical protein
VSLSSGSKLAHYEIVEPIGKGGMGEVYRARDTKLGRDVAIKVLPDEFGQDEERLRRFQREAKVLASLNHPNIAAIYGLEEEDDTHYLVLELVPGETLAERIARGPIPVEEALEIATKIADALEEAHERGIVHRDLKPANVKLTEGGKIKVLDFGLAKAFAEEGAEGDAATSMSPTITRDATRVGVILGTAAYMSPEQAKGKQIDRRADVWAFGAVLYEMLTGRRAFEGEDVSETLAYVLTKEPDWDALPADTPPALRRTLQLCLTKKPKGRIRDMADMQLALAGAFGTVEAAHDGTHSPRSVGWAAIGIGLILGGILTGVAVWRLKPEAPRRPARFVVNAPSEAPSVARVDLDLTISPDGTRIVYATISGEGQLFVRDLNALEATPLSGLGDNPPRGPFFSPEGNWVGYFSGPTLKKVSILGGPPLTLCEVPSFPRGASWGANGFIVFASGAGLWHVPEGGGEPEELIPRPEGGGYAWPEILPGGRGVLLTVTSGPAGENAENTRIGVLPPGNREVKTSMRAATRATFRRDTSSMGWAGRSARWASMSTASK